MKMKVIRTISEMKAWARETHSAGLTIGFVPTMGYLHEGHLSLIRQAKKQSDRLVVSIYVNPTQFGPNEDWNKYPRDFKRDQHLCEQEGVDLVFYPDDRQMYNPNHRTYIVTEELASVLCGRSRPNHFRGVTTVVAKLFHIVQPDVAVFGQKDAQQAILIRRMIEDLNFDVKLIVAPIVRERDGLALSSRNKYLTSEERKQATVLYRSLQRAEQEYKNGNRDAEQIKRKMMAMIEQQPLAHLDYVELRDAETLGPARTGQRDVLVAVAVFFGSTRLIDNTVLKTR